MSSPSLSNTVAIGNMFFPMTNMIQHYEWGSYSAFTELWGIDNSQQKPQAEIWMGAHCNGCSTVLFKGSEIKLSLLIETNKSLFLSNEIAKEYSELPFLFKVLAAEKALSIQVHPSKKQAQKGFIKEDKMGIDISSDLRNYKDSNHKPELVYALTDYQVMNGFRPIKDIINCFLYVEISEISTLLNDFVINQTSEGLRNFFYGLLSLQGEIKKAALFKLLTIANKSNDALFSLVSSLANQYPHDLGLFCPLLLNVITLRPGEAMFLDAQTPHAYIKGTGLEIMANSDNVLRAGLTSKHVDINELIRCTDFREKYFENLLLEPVVHNNTLQYPIPVCDFNFAIILHSEDHKIITQGAEILLSIDETTFIAHDNGDNCLINKGESIFIPAYVKNYYITSKGRVARAYS